MLIRELRLNSCPHFSHQFAIFLRNGIFYETDGRSSTVAGQFGHHFMERLAQLQQVFNLFVQLADGKRLFDIHVRSILKTFNLSFQRSFCRQQDDRNMGVFNICLDFSRQLQTIHLRHHHVADNHVYRFIGKHFKRLPAVLGFQDFKPGAQ